MKNNSLRIDKRYKAAGYTKEIAIAQTAKTRGGTLEAPAHREENYTVAGKISIFENMAPKGLPKTRKRIAKVCCGSNKLREGFWERGLCQEVLKYVYRGYYTVARRYEFYSRVA